MTADHSTLGWSRRRRLIRGTLASAVAGLVFGSALLALPPVAQAAGPHAARASGPYSHPRYKTRVKRKWGIELVGVRPVAVGYMLVFRYKVIDAEKAKPVHVRRTKPVLIDEATGARFIVPAPQKTGPLRNSNLPQEGRIYSMLFANPGQYVKTGNRVTVEIGDFRAEDMVVQ
jgi:hypothetical protein